MTNKELIELASGLNACPNHHSFGGSHTIGRTEPSIKGEDIACQSSIGYQDAPNLGQPVTPYFSRKKPPVRKRIQ